MHPRLTELLDFVERHRADFADAVQSIPAARRGQSPGRNRWSVAEVVEHVAVVERRLAGSFPIWVADAQDKGVSTETETSPVLPGIDVARMVNRSTRVGAPAPVQPTGKLSPDDAWRDFEEAHRQIVAAMKSTSGLALGAIARPHPIFGPLNLYQWYGFVGAHLARHAAQIREIGAGLDATALWADVDQYIADVMVPTDEALDAALAATAAAGMPAIQVSAAQGQMLHIFAKMTGARAILEIGTLGGYSTIWLGRALAPGGRLVTLEADATHVEIARGNIVRAGLGQFVQIKHGPALETLPGLKGPFDFIFIDADKPNIPEYFRHALRLSRPGSVIVVDNVIRDGAVIDATSKDPNVQGVRRFNDLVAAETRVRATTIQTVGSKGYDGFALVIVK